MSTKDTNSTSSNSSGRRRYWQSLEERLSPSVPVWQLPEFGDTPAEELKKDSRNGKFSRASFLKFLGAGSVMAAAACRRPTEQIVPAVVQSPEYVPGHPEFYSSVAPDGTGLIIRTREARPVKIAGNPDHPLTKGGVSASNVAALMDLYDPDRARHAYKKNGGSFKKAKAEDIIAEAASALKGKTYALITGPVESPSSKALIADFMKAFPGGRHVELRQDPTLRQIAEGQKASYGAPVIPNYRFNKADYILAIEADFMGTMPGSTYFTAQFAEKRTIEKDRKSMNRLVVFESMFTLTGSNADTRMPIRAGDAHAVALSVAAALVEQGAVNASADVKNLLSKYSPDKIAPVLKISAETIKETASELAQFKGRSIVIGGSPLAAGESGTALAVAVNLLNSLLENDGKTVDASKPLNFSAGASDAEIAGVFTDIASGRTEAVVMIGANPVYHLPASLNAAETLSKAAYVLSIADRIDESGEYAHAFLPVSHFLESWGDSEMISGVSSVRQPAVRPIFATKSAEDYLIAIAGGSLGGASTFHEYIMNRWKGLAKGDFRSFWNSVLRMGFYAPGREAALNGTSAARKFNEGSLAAADYMPKAGQTLGLYYNVQILDGTGANNPYRQELPEPVTKIVWENYVVMLPATARSLKIKQGQFVTLKTEQGSVSLPVHLLPGVHPDSVFVAMGYGRTKAGRVGNGRGQSVTGLFAKGKNGVMMSGLALSEIRPESRRHKLPTTQTIFRYNHNTEQKAFFTPEAVSKSKAFGTPFDGSSQYNRPIVLEATLKDFAAHPDIHTFEPHLIHAPEYEKATLMKPWPYDGMRWHMAIDLNLCTGCGACVTSCNIENNIPMVGPDQVYVGREMHWLRIDRYFSGSEENPEVVHQPMLCQHCENAPCENVCPVAATQHNSEGLNVMAYNRCIGTRYCANNCPYKVRRFNWLEYWYRLDGASVNEMRDPHQLGFNPDVSVRSRGVIEKCSFCLHRINQARTEMRTRGEEVIADGTVQTACEEVCPTKAIVFGNINDKNSRVWKLVQSNEKIRGYKVLDYLEVKPSVTYLGKIRNKA